MLLKGIAAVSAVAAVLICICGGVAFWWLPALFVGTFLVLTLAAFGFLCLVCAFVDMDKPQEHDSPFYRRVTQVYIDALVSLLRVRIHTTGLEKVPTEGRFVLVCNHLFTASQRASWPLSPSRRIRSCSSWARSCTKFSASPSTVKMTAPP